MTRVPECDVPTPRTAARFLPYLASAVALPAMLVLAGCGSSADAERAVPTDNVVPVRVVEVSSHRPGTAQVISVTGTLAGKEEVSLAFKIGGVVSRIVVDPGQPVRAGQVLAELRPTEIAAQVASAQEARRKAERDLARVTKLYADSVATLEQLQDAPQIAEFYELGLGDPIPVSAAHGQGMRSLVEAALDDIVPELEDDDENVEAQAASDRPIRLAVAGAPQCRQVDPDQRLVGRRALGGFRSAWHHARCDLGAFRAKRPEV